jgi:transposase
MASLDTRAYIAASHNHYLCPLSAVQMPVAALQDLLVPVWTGAQSLTPVHRAPEKESDTPELIANGFSYRVTLKVADVEWQEQRLVVHSLKHARAKQKALDERLKTAEQEIDALNRHGRGRKRLTEAEVRAAVDCILKHREGFGLLTVDYTIETQLKRKRAYAGRPAQDAATVTVSVRAKRDAPAYEKTVRALGWRVFVCNDLELDLGEAVLAYREEYLVERGFRRFRGKTLGMTPLYLSSTTRIKGLIRLLCIGLRVLCLVEFAVREALQEKSEKLAGIYAANPKRATAKPTTEMMLRSFVGISMVVLNFGGADCRSVTPLNPVQSRILNLLGFPTAIYQGLNVQSGDVHNKIGEP